jgi:hypothetical protein
MCICMDVAMNKLQGAFERIDMYRNSKRDID